ncbi:MAG: hypothetical protein NZ927_05900 [Candidatus Calescibacterium sp.]|nr:hypothetical protein [Candidatus Calescibacterium sp.]MCX7734572.1 hypothetical protein [bacterium]
MAIFFCCNFGNKELKIVERIGETDSSFRPHGIDFFSGKLYVILNDEKEKLHPVAVYTME